MASFTPAGLAGGVTLVTSLRPAVWEVAWRAALEALSPLPQVEVVLPTVQTVFVTTTPTLVTRWVTSITNHGGGIAKVTEKERGCLVCFLIKKGKETLCVCVFFLLL